MPVPLIINLQDFSSQPGLFSKKKKIRVNNLSSVSNPDPVGSVSLGRIRIRYPGSGSADPDPHQNVADPKH